MVNRNSIKLLISQLNRNRTVWMTKNFLKRCLVRPPKPTIVDDSDRLGDVERVELQWPDVIEKPFVGLVKDATAPPYWTRFRRFLETNGIRYEFYNPSSSDWLEKGKVFDAILWRPASTAIALEEVRQKVYVLEKVLGKAVLPSFDAAMLYENKLLLYELLLHYRLPVVNAFVTYDREEALKECGNLSYPILSKVSNNAGSLGVEMVRSQSEAEAIVGEIFSWAGRPTREIGIFQKGYVYFQKFLPNTGFDLRVIVVDDMVFGYYRDVPKGDFRASGMGIYRKEGIPSEALDLARQVASVFRFPLCAVDLIESSETRSYHIIEVSPFFQVDTPEQLHVDGVSGAYHYVASSGRYTFLPGKYWVQELALRSFLREKFLRKN